MGLIIRVDLYSLIPMAQQDPNPTHKHKLSPLLSIINELYHTSQPTSILTGNYICNLKLITEKRTILVFLGVF